MDEAVDRRLLLGVAGVAGVAALARMANAGPLDPPQGGVAPTGRTLQEIYSQLSKTDNKVARTPAGFAECRIPVQSLPSSPDALYVISQPGAYYLTDNLTQQAGMACIDIQSDHVDLDCGGFAFFGSGSAASSCVRASGRVAIEIYDAAFRGWQGCCIDCDDCDDCFVSDCLFDSCVNPADPATGAGGEVCRLGVSSDIDDCVVRDCVGCALKVGDSSSVTCVTCLGGVGDAIRCANGCCADDCLVSQNSGWGVVCGNQCTISENRIMLCWGVSCAADCVVCENELAACGGGGSGGSITVQGPRCCIEENHVSGGGGSGGGILVLIGADACLIDGNHLAGADAAAGSTGAGAIMIQKGVSRCTVVRNHIHGASTTSSFVVPASNSFGPVAVVNQGGDLSANPAASHPWANFIY